MRRKLWLLLILFLFLVGRERCCASQGLVNAIREGFKSWEKLTESHRFLFPILKVFFTSLGYWYFDLHQKEKGWYTCKFFYAGGYRTKLFYNRIYFDFYSSFPRMIVGFCRNGFLGIVFFSFWININIRIYRDFYIVLSKPVLPILLSVVLLTGTLLHDKIHSFL